MRFSALLVLSLAVAPLTGCGTSAQRDEDAGVERSKRDVVSVSASDQKSIALATVTATSREVQDQLQLVGWSAVKPGHDVIIKAPAAGFVTAPDGSQLAVMGQSVQANERLATLRVFLSPQEQSQLVATKEDADTAIKQASVSMKLAAAQLERLKSAPNTLSGMQIDRLRETYERSKVAQQEAFDKLPFLPEEPYKGPLQLQPVAITAPINGRIIQMHVSPRQLVAPGDPVWTLADWSVLWVRVPVFEEDLPRIARQVSAQVTVPGSHESLRAARLDVPQPAKPGQRTIDVWFEMENVHDQLRPGQAVTVEIATGATNERIVVPRAALVWDGMGNAWVYTQIGPDSFRRQRVETGTSIDDDVAIQRGLVGGEKVVTAGVESLYGEEFKSDLNVDDD
jgi:membrane fusion protein, heavy metal efflux system